MERVIRIGTRGSRLALRQAGLVAEALNRAHPAVRHEIVTIRTSGDWKPEEGETRLSEAAGGKGLFAREIEAALSSSRIDCGVHSMKDMPSFLPDGLIIRHMLPREDARDAFLANDCMRLEDLKQGAVVGTSSLRRQAFLLAKRPDLQIVPLRGNVPTRIEKLRAGQVDATLLAIAGLMRLNLDHEAAAILMPADMLPAAGQGAIGIEIREDNTDLAKLLDGLHCRTTGMCVAAERAALQVLDGSCHTPIGAYAELNGGTMTLTAAVASPDGREFFTERRESAVGSDAEAQRLGEAVGGVLKRTVPPRLLQ